MPTAKHKQNRSQRGSVVVMAIFLAFFVAVLMISLELLQLSDLETATNQIKDMEAYYCAEAGVETMIFLWRVGFVGVPSTNPYSATFGPFTCAFSGAATTRTTTFDVWTSKADPNIDYYHYINIDSIGNTSNYSRKVFTSLRRTWLVAGLPDTRYMQIVRWREL